MKKNKSQSILNGLLLIALVAIGFGCMSTAAGSVLHEIAANGINLHCPSIPIYQMVAGGGLTLSMATVVSRPVQLQKILKVAKDMGENADTAQFSERCVYDQLPLDGRTEFRFFEGCNVRAFPDTNLTENKLQKQENMVIKYISFQITVFSAAFALPVVSTEPLSTTAANAGFYRGDMSFQIGQNQVIKPFPIDDMKPEFNPFARHTSHNVIRLGVDLVIPEFIEFISILKVTSGYTASTIRKIMMKLHGQATILSPRTNF